MLYSVKKMKTKKKNKIKISNYILTFILVVTLITLGLSGFNSVYVYGEESESNNKLTDISFSEPGLIYPKETSLTLFAVGDSLIHGSVYKTNFDNGSYNFNEMLELIKPYSSEADLAYYNQETILGGEELGFSSYPTFNTPEEFGDNMVDAGFNLVSLANNHTLDKGVAGIAHSVNFWNSYENVIATGSSLSVEEQENIEVLEINGITYTMLSYTTLTNGIPVPSGKEYLVNLYDYEEVKKDVEEAQEKADLVIVAMHFGTEYTHTPTGEQVEIATELANLGVNIVIGNHPHVIEPIEFIDNTLVMYALGNLVSAQIGIERLVGLMVNVEITKVQTSDTESYIEINKVEAGLHHTYYRNWNNYKVYPFELLNDYILNDYEEIYDEFMSIVGADKDDRIVIKDIN